MTSLTTSDRISAAAVGAVFGAMVGFALAWIIGIYSNTLGSGFAEVSFKHWATGCAIGFGVVGLVFGPYVGTLLGSVISGIFEFESADKHVPTWPIVLALLAIIAGVWWSGGNA